MRVAFSGAHRVGKTTLIEAVAETLPGYTIVDEPYVQLAEEGHELSDPPTRDDYELQLRRSLDLIRDVSANALVDRCPLDFLAYLRALDADYDVDDWLPEIRDAMVAIDLVVVVMIEQPDRITVSASEDRALRREVDALIQTYGLEDAFGIETETLAVTGDLPERCHQVLAAMR